MFWYFMMLAGLAAIFAKLGAMLVMVKVLVVALACMAVLAATLGVALVFRRLGIRRSE